jgi:hypothetical protein
MNNHRAQGNVTASEICYILGLADGGLTHEHIALTVGRDRSTITKVVGRYSWTTWVGRPSHASKVKTTTERDDRMLVRAALTNRVTILKDVSNITALSISPRTIQRRLKEAGIQKHIAVTKPFLTREHQERRYCWALEHADWTVEDWNRVIWSDESSIEIGRDTRPCWVFRRPDERYHSDCLKPSFKSKRVSIMVWGCFAGSQMGQLVAYPKGGITAVEYINTLRQSLLPFILQLNNIDDAAAGDQIQVATMGNYIYMHDNAPIHRAGASEAFLAEHRINTMWWPANSPDLNPIENLWHSLKVKFHHEFFTARHATLSRAEQAITEYMEGLIWIWSTQLGDLPQKLVDSMPRRVQAVLHAKGGHTHY